MRDISGNELDDPQSIIEADARLVSLAVDIEVIEAQLASNRQFLPDGSVMSYREFCEWRSRARFALAAKRTERIQLKAWVANRKKGVPTPQRLSDLQEIGRLACKLHANWSLTHVISGDFSEWAVTDGNGKLVSSSRNLVDALRDAHEKFKVMHGAGELES